MQATTLLIHFICYAVFFVLSSISKINNNQRLISDEGIFTSKPGNLIGSHIIGMLWLGLVPVVVLKYPVLNLLTGNTIPDGYSVFLFLLISVLVITIIFKQSKKANTGKTGSYENLTRLSHAFIIRYFVIRVLFLFVYELWFRGFLLFDCISQLGIAEAVIINVLLYVLVHIFYSKREMLACIPFGILASTLSIFFNAVWPAILLHIGVSLVYEINTYRSYLITPKLKML